MATINAAVSCNIKKQVICAVFAVFTALSVTACSIGSESLLPGFSMQGGNTSRALQPQRVTAPTKGDIAIAPLIGPPNAISTKLTSQIEAELAKKSINIIRPIAGSSTPPPQSKYTLRGYVVAATEVVGVKVSYIWDITDVSGQRIKRITGEDIVKGAASKDPWAVVSPQILTKIAGTTANSVAQWLPSHTPETPVSSSSASTLANVKLAKGAHRTLASNAIANSGNAASVKTNAPSQVVVYVPRITGAPGDGSTSLSTALKNQLRRSGLNLVENSMETAHVVEGNVVMGVPQAGRQAIKIDWVVKNSFGKKLGTVSQKNKIPAGSLNGKWGATAAAAASAAAQGIIRLLPKNSIARS